MKKNLTIFYLGAFLLTCFFSCDIVNPEEDIPAYIHIPDITLTTNTVSEGTASEKITVAYVFVNNNNIGIYALPATIPVLETGEQAIEVFAGITENGVSGIVAAYPFYNSYEINLTLEPEKVDTIFPTVTYRGDANFVFDPQEGFESSGTVFNADLDANEMTEMEISTVDIFEGNGSGLIHFTAEDEQLQVGSLLLSGLVGNNEWVYMEMNYKSDVDFAVGILGYDERGDQVLTLVDKGVRARPDWNKIYFNFTEEYNTLRTSSFNIVAYRFAIYATLLDSDLEEANIYLDNIKLVQ